MSVYIESPIGMSYSYNTMLHLSLNVYTYFRFQSSVCKHMTKIWRKTIWKWPNSQLQSTVSPHSLVSGPLNSQWTQVIWNVLLLKHELWRCLLWFIHDITPKTFHSLYTSADSNLSTRHIKGLPSIEMITWCTGICQVLKRHSRGYYIVAPRYQQYYLSQPVQPP